MALPSSGQISMSQVNVELGLGGTTQISLNQSTVRTLFEKTTAGSAIAMSDGWGKSNAQITATGGTIVTDGDWKYHYFYSTANITFTQYTLSSYAVKVLLVGGGNAGGDTPDNDGSGSGINGAPGGNGGQILINAYPWTVGDFGLNTAWTMYVGAGAPSESESGGNSSLSTVVAYGGSGASRGYGGANGNPGGNGTAGNNGTNVNTSPFTGSYGGYHGGAGGGGGGGGNQFYGNGGTGGGGGLGGGGSGGNGGAAGYNGNNGSNGTVNKGGGGGGAGGAGGGDTFGATGGQGGAGLCIVAYKWRNN